MCYSPDGKTALSGSEDETVIMWDLLVSKQFGKVFNSKCSRRKIPRFDARIKHSTRSGGRAHQRDVVIGDFR